MLRMESETGWWLIRHTDHARLARDFSVAWGNQQFRRPEPRERVLYAIAAHDDGWAERNAHPTITRQGKPSAFSSDLVGKYAGFEEIDIADYLALRNRAARIIADKDPYAGLLVSMHTYSLLTEHADRSTIAPDGLALLDAFLDRLRSLEEALFAAIAIDETLTARERSAQTIQENFRLLQACDNLSLLSCLGYAQPANLLHPLPLNDGTASEVRVLPEEPWHFRLEPWPFGEEQLTFEFPARHVEGKRFDSSRDLEKSLRLAKEEKISVKLSR